MLHPQTPGLIGLSLDAENSSISFGRDHAHSTTTLGITSLQVSRAQGRLRRGLCGTLELTNTGIGLMRVVRPPATTANNLRQSQTVRLLNNDRVQLLHVLRKCDCSLRAPCSCAGGSGDQLDIVYEWVVRLGKTPPGQPQPQQLPASAGGMSAREALAANAAKKAAVASSRAKDSPPRAPLQPKAAAEPAAAAAAAAAPPAKRDDDASALSALSECVVQARRALASFEAALPPDVSLPPAAAKAHADLTRSLELAAKAAAEATGGSIGDGSKVVAEQPDSEDVVVEDLEAAAKKPPAAAPAKPAPSKQPSPPKKASPSKKPSPPKQASPPKPKPPPKASPPKPSTTTAMPPPAAKPKPPPPARAPSMEPVQSPNPKESGWQPEEPFEAERLYISELHADEGWVQCDRCNKWRPPIKPTKSSNKKRRTTLCGGGNVGSSTPEDEEEEEDDEEDAKEEPSPRKSVGNVEGVTDDGEWWECSMHPDPRYATCDSAAVYGPVGDDHQVSLNAIPEYRGPPLPRRPPLPRSAAAAAAASKPSGSNVISVLSEDDDVEDEDEKKKEEGGAVVKEEEEKMEDDEDDDVLTARHSRLRPISNEELEKMLPKKAPRGKKKGGATGKRKAAGAARALPELPPDDSQRPENVYEAEEERRKAKEEASGEEGSGSGGDGEVPDDVYDDDVESLQGSSEGASSGEEFAVAKKARLSITGSCKKKRFSSGSSSAGSR